MGQYVVWLDPSTSKIWNTYLPKMTVTILGDLNLSQLLINPKFRSTLNLDFVFCPSTSLVSFHQYRTLLPVGTRYLVVGCLAPLLGDQQLTADVELSTFRMQVTLIIFCYLITFCPEHLTIEFSTTLSDILDANSGLRAMIIRPLPRPGPGPFGAGLTLLTVRDSCKIIVTCVHFFALLILALYACNGYEGRACPCDASFSN